MALQNNKRVASALILLACAGALSCNRASPLRLEVLTRKGDIGLTSGPTNLYSVRVRNQSFWPVTIEGVALKGGYPALGTWYRYEVQRWDEQKRTWITAVQVDPRKLTVDHVVRSRLWPGKTIDVTPWEATGARNAFQRGDRARFALHLSIDDGKTVAFSPPFEPQL